MAVTSQPGQKLACFDLPDESGCLDIVDMQGPYIGTSSCDETAWMADLWDREDASVASASSLMDGTDFDLDCSSVEASENVSVDRAASSLSPRDTAASLDKAGPSSFHAEVITWEARLPLSLQLDYSSVLSAWKQLGGAVHEPSVPVPIAAVSLQLPAPGASDGALLAAFGSYGCAHVSCSSGPFIGSDAGSAPTSPTAPNTHRGVPMFVPVGMVQQDSRMEGDMIAARNIFGSASGPLPLMPLIPTGSNGSDWCLLAVGAAPAALKGGEIKSADARSARAACALRCKQKKSCRQVVKVRYEMRKINAEQRPRFKGRFVKRDTMHSQDSLAQTSESSASEFSDVPWLV